MTIACNNLTNYAAQIVFGYYNTEKYITKPLSNMQECEMICDNYTNTNDTVFYSSLYTFWN